MSDVKQFRLPDVGEGLTEAEIVSWRVRPGDTVAVNDVIVEIETAKSLVELPCPFAGTVAELLADEGATVAVGAPIIGVRVGDGPADRGDALAEDLVPSPPPEAAVEPGLIGGPAPGGRTSVLVGYGPRTTEARRRPRKTGPSGSPPGHGGSPPPAPPAQRAGSRAPGRVLAKPPVRKLAKDLGVDLSRCTPSGDGGVVTRQDVLALAGSSAAAGADSVPGAQPVPQAVAAEPGSRETRLPVRGVRKHTAAAMVASAFTAPHVTEFVAVDVTRSMELLERVRARREFRDVKVSPLLLVAKAVLLAVRRTPEVNASWVEDAGTAEIVLKHYVNLGIAAATPRGLLVPVVRDADRMSLLELATAVNQLAVTAREGRTAPGDLAGGTFTITNVGVFGVDTGTPIINPGEAAILAVGAVRDMPWVVDGAVVPRKVVQLALSFDHRMVDGQQGSQFLADVAAVLEDPGLALLA